MTERDYSNAKQEVSGFLRHQMSELALETRLLILSSGYDVFQLSTEDVPCLGVFLNDWVRGS